MKKVFVYLGLNIEKLQICTGGKAKGIYKNELVINSDETSRHMIEADQHPVKVSERVIREVEYCNKYWNLHISTHSQAVVDTLCTMIREGQLSKDQVIFYIMDESNSKVERISSVDGQGYLVDWPVGYFHWERY